MWAVVWKERQYEAWASEQMTNCGALGDAPPHTHTQAQISGHLRFPQFSREAVEPLGEGAALLEEAYHRFTSFPCSLCCLCVV